MRARPADLIPVLQDIQDEFNYLPKDELKMVADRLQVPLTQVYSVATFFKMFSLEPKGKPPGPGLPGHRLPPAGRPAPGGNGGPPPERRSRATPPRTCNSPWRRWAASGSCAQAPLMMIDDKYFGRMAVDKVPKILKLYTKPDQELRHDMPKFESIKHLEEYRGRLLSQPESAGAPGSGLRRSRLPAHGERGGGRGLPGRS